MVPITYNVRSLMVRKTTTAATALGIGLVVFVMAASMMLSNGIRKTMSATGEPDHAIVIRKGSDAELSSSIDSPTAKLVMESAGVKKTDAGPMAVAEVLMVIAMDKAGAPGQIGNVQVRGVPDNALAFRNNVAVVDGRPPQPGTDEVIIGSRIVGRFNGLKMGATFDLKKNRPVTVVGVFDANGSAFESEVWANIDTVRESFGRDNMVSSVTVQLESRTAYDAFAAQVESDKRLGLEVMREREYYEKASELTATFMSILGTAIAIFFSFGAILGALITMHGAVAQRQREIGTLRALGFSRLSIMFSFMLEAVMLSLIGGVLGCVAAACMGFVEFSMMNFATWSEIVFKFEPSGKILLIALFFGGFMGVVGGFLPALRAARTSPIKAMRA
jgi:putative ABC transport system permease protein